MVVTFEEKDRGTEVSILFDHIPTGIRPEDNDAGSRSLHEYPGNRNLQARHSLPSSLQCATIFLGVPEIKIDQRMPDRQMHT
jgi:hypothetical protein